MEDSESGVERASGPDNLSSRWEEAQSPLWGFAIVNYTRYMG